MDSSCNNCKTGATASKWSRLSYSCLPQTKNHPCCYTEAVTKTESFLAHTHPTLQRRVRLFILAGTIMLLVVLWDIMHHTMSVPLALAGIVVGALAGFASSRIYHLTWDHDGQRVVGRIDLVGWIVLILYIAFEVIRALLFESVIHTGFTATAITFTFVSSALISRVFGIRGRILRILKDEAVFH